MNDDLNTLLEIKQGEEPPASRQSSQVTLLARLCQVCSWVCLPFAVLVFIPNGPTTGGPLSIDVYPLLGLGGLMLFCPLTVLFGIVALLRIWLSSKDLKGVAQVFTSLGVAALAFAIFFVGASLRG